MDTSNNNYQLASSSVGPATRTLHFSNSPSPAVGNAPQAIASGDFNGDGVADVAVANISGNGINGSVSILLGNGDGTFTLSSTPTVGFGPVAAMVVGDFNNDGDADIAGANYGDGTVTVLFGKGQGSFTNSGFPAVDAGLSDIQVGDFNRDGYMDLAVTDLSNHVTVFLNKGDGTFPTSLVQSIGKQPSTFAVGDYNGDGIADLAIANTGDNTITVLLGVGDGTFTAASPIPMGSTPERVVSGDFNGDGIADLAVAVSGQQTVQVFLGKGDGSFGPPASFATGKSPYGLTVADFNADGFPDLVTTNSGDGTLSVLLGQGNGSFQSGGTLTAGAGQVGIAAVDLNDDGIPDIAVPNSTNGVANVLVTVLTQTATATVTGIAPPGTHTVQAQFTGTYDFYRSTSSTVNLTSPLVSPSLTLSASPSGSLVGKPVALTATLSPSSASGETTDGETITFYNGNTSLGTAVLASGVAALSVTTLPVGLDALSAAYMGDGAFAAASSTLNFTVNAKLSVATTTALNVTNQYGIEVLTATATAGSTAVCPGLVTFLDGYNVLGTAQLVSPQGTAVFRLPFYEGPHSYEAAFAGANQYTHSFSKVQQVSGGTFGSVTAIAASPTNPYTLTGTVTVNSPTAPTGRINFLDTSNNYASFGLGTLGAATPSVSFLNSSNPTVGASPEAVVTGDFNGDGLRDIAVAN